MSALPFDILENIATFLQDDITTLKHICLVSSQWRLSFQRMLFSNVHINELSSSILFLSAIRDKPSFRLHVRSMKVQFTGPSTGKILSKLPRLEKITIDKRDVLPAEFCDSLRQTLRSKYLTSLTLHQVIWFPLELLNEATALKHLQSSSHTSYTGKDIALRVVEDAEIPSGNRTGPRLHSLSLSSPSLFNCEFLKWITDPRCVLDLRELRSLDIRANGPAEYEFFRGVLTVVPSTLIHLACDPLPQSTIGSTMQAVVDDFNLNRFTHLQSLTLHIYVTPRNLTWFDYIPWCILFLSTIPNPSKLETLTISCDILGFDSEDDYSNINMEEWRDLDSSLTSQSQTTGFSFGRVLMDLKLRGLKLSPMKRLLMERLPGLVREGKLEVFSSEGE